MKLRSPDGWTVEVAVYDSGEQWLTLTDKHGFLHGGGSDARVGGPSFKTAGRFRTPAEVERVIGSEAFAALVPAPELYSSRP